MIGIEKIGMLSSFEFVVVVGFRIGVRALVVEQRPGRRLRNIAYQ